MDANEFGKTVGEIVGVILVILLVIYLISKVIGKGKGKTRRNGIASRPESRKPLAHSSRSKKQASKPPANKADISGNDPERPKQKWV